MDYLKSVCSIPTAPFAEQAVVQYVKDFVAARPRLRLRCDQSGNLLIQLPGRQRVPRWVFTAHMDHPGFVAEKMLDDHTLQTAFRGWVKIDFVRGAKAIFFDGAREIAGRVLKATAADYDKIPVPRKVILEVADRVPKLSPGMFDLGVGRYSDGKFYCRAIDDLGGAAACLAMLDELHDSPPRTPIAVLLTRAEEEGFIGCIAACLHRQLLRKSDRVVAIECSAMQSYARQGDGVIIRVGDRTSIFNSGLTYFLSYQAEKLAGRDKSFKYQRALMPGGTCEATVYDIYGYTAGSICVPLGNYHNMDVAAGKLAAEYIDATDWKNMVKLFTHLARTGHEFAPGHAMLKQRLEKRFAKLARFLG